METQLYNSCFGIICFRHRLNIYTSSGIALVLCRGYGQWAPQTRFSIRSKTAIPMNRLGWL